MRKASHWRYGMPLVAVPVDLMVCPRKSLAYDSLRPNYDVLSVAYLKHAAFDRTAATDLCRFPHLEPASTIEYRRRAAKNNRRHQGAGCPLPPRLSYELALSTVTARRFCDQHEMSLQTATGRSLP